MSNQKLIITGRDLIKGWTEKSKFSMYECTPWQLLEETEKGPEWKEWVADYFEWIGLRQVKSKAPRILKNRRMAAGIIDIEDYSVQRGEMAHYLGIETSENENDPFSKFHPFIPPVIKVLDGEFIKRNTKIHVYCTDRQSVDDKLEYKTKMFNDVLINYAKGKKQMFLQEQGIVPISEEEMSQMGDAGEEQMSQFQQQNEKYYSELEAAKKLQEVENKYRNFRHVHELFAQHVHNKDHDRFRMSEMEREAFIETLCNSEESFWLDMKEDKYIPRFLDSACTFHHMSSSVKYGSQGDYIGYFDDMTLGDIINVLGRELTPDQIDMLKEETNSLNAGTNSNGIMTDDQKGMQGAYYDTSRPYPLGQVNKGVAQFNQDNLVRENFVNGISEYDYSNRSSIFGNKSSYYKPKMFRVMHLQFKSQSKIGWLTKKDEAGLTVFQDFVDENYKITVKPKYDKSLKNEEKKTNLVYGEHIDWEWRNEWRTIKKINSNTEHSFWKNSATAFKPIYIGGDRNTFQFSGDDPFECYPAAESTQFKMKQTRPVSLVDLAAPTQININIAMNKIPQIMFDDIGLVTAYNKNIINVNRPGLKTTKDPLDSFMQNLHENKMIEMNIDSETLRAAGNTPLVPQAIDLSRIREAVSYMQLASMIKVEGMEILGISRQRLAQAKASESATGIEAGVNLSETQTEPYFHQHIVEFMPRLYQRMIEAAQYYCSKSESARVYYQTSKEENIFLEIEDMKGLPRTYNIKVTSDIREQKIKERLTQLFMTNNTAGATLLELADGVATDSVTDTLELLRKSQVEKEKKEEQMFQRQQQEADAQREAMASQQEKSFENEMAMLQMKLDSQERQTEVRALGGINTDANSNNELDSYENLDRLLKEKEMGIKESYNNEVLNLSKQKQMDNISIQREAMSSKERIENKKLAIALSNQNKNDDKKLNRDIAKKQLK